MNDEMCGYIEDECRERFSEQSEYMRKFVISGGIMKVWLLESFCSDTADYDFVGIFAQRAGAINYVLTEYPETYELHNQTETQSEMWSEGTFTAADPWNRLDKADFLISLQEVK